MMMLKQLYGNWQYDFNKPTTCPKFYSESYCRNHISWSLCTFNQQHFMLCIKLHLQNKTITDGLFCFISQGIKPGKAWSYSSSIWLCGDHQEMAKPLHTGLRSATCGFTVQAVLPSAQMVCDSSSSCRHNSDHSERHCSHSEAYAGHQHPSANCRYTNPSLCGRENIRNFQNIWQFEGRPMFFLGEMLKQENLNTEKLWEWRKDNNQI